MKNKEHLANFNIAGFTYYNGVDCFNKLKVGKTLQLVLEEDNKYDARAIAIYYKEFKLGFVPKQENRFLYKLLKQGFDENVSAKIQQVNADEYPEQQIRVVVHLLAI